MEKLRISGGSRRGRKLLSPPKNTIRPASDLVRQAVFNMLGEAVEGCVFYDVFAGTGIVGLEALSRGAERAIFIEKDRRQTALIQKNLERARFGPEGSVRASDAFLWAKHFLSDTRPTIVFLGPPYPDFKDQEAAMLQLVAGLQLRLKPEDLLVFQFPRSVHFSKLPEQDRWRRLRQYGKTQIGIWSSEPEAESSPLEDEDLAGDEAVHDDALRE